MAQIKHWEQSGKPQLKSRKTPQKYRQWLAAHKRLVIELRKGINQEGKRNPSFIFYALQII